ncbi:hypothetical protein PSQ90_09475 [Devosia rhodophyticola]|uniref:Uncharacterized protein n=1 Tax=Devosia rhodophyticola TaxID=3026423 RepID=A0ABY7YT59_9HYPH|nr:hypothetical protein [Devosia rhodophyticola]WDR04563.1 hypothetical protein PSQ90_09475 [Devosia rhodophyticola]
MTYMLKYVAVAGLIAALALGFVITTHAQETVLPSHHDMLASALI